MKNPFPKFQKTAEGSWFFVLSDVNTDDSALERELVCSFYLLEEVVSNFHWSNCWLYYKRFNRIGLGDLDDCLAGLGAGVSLRKYRRVTS